MIQQIMTAFPKLQSACLDKDSRDVFYVDDPGGKLPCVIIKENLSAEEAESYVKVNNRQPTTIHFIAIDKCLTKDMERKSCEAVLLNDRKIVFLELKLGVTTPRQQNADDTREHALFAQIAPTIQLFHQELTKNNSSFSGIEVVAQVAMSKVSPRSLSTYKLIKSAFGERYGYDYIDSLEVEFD